MEENDTLQYDPIEEEESQFSFFLPSKNYWVTPVFIYLNLILFAIMVTTGVSVFEPQIPDLLKWGANQRHDIVAGDYWRLFTSQFLHIGILHLGFNLYALFFIGYFLEPIIGSINFLIFYLAAGLVGSIASVIYHPFTVSAGASGAIFGMYGLFLALLTTNLINKPDKKSILASIGVFIVFNLMNGLNAQSGIDNAAHIGGLVSGLFFGYFLYPVKKFNLDNKISYAVGILLFASIYFVGKNKISNLPDPAGKYEYAMKKFSKLEDEALEAAKLPEGTPSSVIILKIDNGLVKWNQCAQLLNELKNEDLPSKLIDRNTLLIEYVRLRIDLYKLYRKAVEENTNQYEVEINQIMAKTQEVMQMLQ